MIKVPVINKSNNALPEYQTEQSAGVDLRAYLEHPIEIAPLHRVLIPTGLYMALPLGYEAQIRPRSGLAYKHGITVLNSPGTIDADYRGELKILLINHGSETFKIENGERIAQMIVHKYEQVTFSQVAELDDTERGSGGYGHTGK